MIPKSILSVSVSMSVAFLSGCASTTPVHSAWEPVTSSPRLSDAESPSSASTAPTITDPITDPKSTAPLAAESDERTEGRWEFTLGGAGRNDKNFDQGGFTLTAGLGYYLTNSLELGVRQNVTEFDDGNTSWNGSTRVALDFNLGRSTIRPFLGANIGYVYGDSVHDTWEAAPEAGLKVYFSHDVFLQLLAEYQFFFQKSDDAANAFDDGQFVYSLGLGLNF